MLKLIVWFDYKNDKFIDVIFLCYLVCFMLVDVVIGEWVIWLLVNYEYKVFLLLFDKNEVSMIDMIE